MFYAHVTWYCHDILQSTYGNHLVSCTGDPLAQTVKSDTCHAEVIVFKFPGNAWNCIFWTHYKWLYIKVETKYIKNRCESTSMYRGIIIGHNHMTTVLAQYSSVRLMLCYKSKMQKNTQLLLHWTEVYWFPKCNACRGSQRVFCQFPGPFLEFLDGQGIRLTLAKAALYLYFDH